MKRVLFAIAATALSLPAIAADVGVSISIGQPGFYGQLDIGNFPRPQLMYPQPVIIAPAPVMVREPLYLHVPPGHAKHWRKFCGRYDACGRPVYFVRDDWYNNVYVPRYRERYRDRDEGPRYEGPPERYDRSDRRDDRRDERGDDRDDRHDRGRGHSKGRGHDD